MENFISAAQKTLLLLFCFIFFFSSCAPTAGPDLPGTLYKKTQGQAPQYDLSAPPGPAPEGVAVRDYDFWLSETEKLLDPGTPENGPHYSKVGDSSSYAWGTSYAMRGLYTAYCTTLDQRYLDTYAQICRNMYDTLADQDKDGYLGWGTGAYSGGEDYHEYAVHTGLSMKGWGDFILLIKSDPDLWELDAPGGTNLLELSGLLLKACEEHLIPSFDRDFSAALGIYMNRPGSGNWGGSLDEYSLPHNQYLGMAIGLYSIALVSPENAAYYIARAESMSSAFKSFLHKYEDIVIWQYADKFHAGDVSYTAPEDFSHGSIDYLAAIESFGAGGAFTLSDLKLFAHSLMTVMFAGDYSYPFVSYNVDGSGGSGNTPYIYNIMLSRYDPEVWHLCATSWDRDRRGTDAPLLLGLHPDSPAPEAFSLTAPAAKSTVSPPGTAFLWTPSKYAADYCLEISGKKDFSDKAVDRPYITNNGAYVEGLRPGRTYYWRVTARSASGEILSSETSSFKTGKAAEYEKKLLSFDYFFTEKELASELSIRVYANRFLCYELPAKAAGLSGRVELDLTGIIGAGRDCAVRVELYSPGAKPDGGELLIDNLALSGSATPAYDFEDGTSGYILGEPRYFAALRDSGAVDGRLSLALPEWEAVGILEEYMDPIYDYVNASVSVGFILN